MMKKIIFALLSFTSMNVFAATDVRGRLTVTPVVGFERVQKFYPTAHMENRTTLGVIAIYRFPIVALETEYSHSTGDDENATTKYEDTEDKLRVGVRGTTTLNSFLGAYIRGGAQATKTKLKTTVNNTSTQTDTTTKINPYVGAGVDFRVMTYVSLTADVLATYVPAHDPNLSDFEIQPSVGISLKF